MLSRLSPQSPERPGHGGQSAQSPLTLDDRFLSGVGQASVAVYVRATIQGVVAANVVPRVKRVVAIFPVDEVGRGTTGDRVVARTASEVVFSGAPQEGVATAKPEDAIRPVQSRQAVVGIGAREGVGEVGAFQVLDAYEGVRTLPACAVA